MYIAILVLGDYIVKYFIDTWFCVVFKKNIFIFMLETVENNLGVLLQ